MARLTVDPQRIRRTNLLERTSGGPPPPEREVIDQPVTTAA